MRQQKYDIVIIGAGSAGVAAAISASSESLSVLLIEKSNRIGGMATQSEVGTICGLYLNDDSPVFTYNVDDFTREFSVNVQQLSNSSPVINKDGLKFLPYKIEAFENHCKDLLQKHKVDIWLNTELTNVQMNKEKITSLTVLKENDTSEVLPQSVIDTSGVNIVSELVGVELQSISYQQNLTHIFTIENTKFKSEENLAFILLLKTKNQFDVSIVPGSFSVNEVALKFNFEDKNTDVVQEIEKVFSFLKENIAGFSNARIKSLADETGLRIGDRAEGEYVLTENDVLTCRKFPNSSANGNWPIEIWKANQQVEIKSIKKNDFYQIPATCLKSKNIQNLFFAGRNISADENAIASARVIGTCLQTGFAVGKIVQRSLRGK